MFFRLLVFFLGATFLSSTMFSNVTAQDAAAENRIASEHLLPSSTKAWFSVPDYDQLVEQFESTQFGKLTE